jgi:hypothetical protein
MKFSSEFFLKKTAEEASEIISEKLSQTEVLITKEREKLNVLKEIMKKKYLQSFQINGEDNNEEPFNIVEYEDKNEATLEKEDVLPTDSPQGNPDYKEIIKVLSRIVEEEEEDVNEKTLVKNDQPTTSSIPSASFSQPVTYFQTHLSNSYSSSSSSSPLSSSLSSSSSSPLSSFSNVSQNKLKQVFTGMIVERDDSDEDI